MMFAHPVLIFLSMVASAAAGAIELSTSDLSSGSPSIGNVKASWGTSLDIGGHTTNVAASYDMKAKNDMIKEAKLSGSIDAVSYALTQNFINGITSLALSTKKFGATLKATADSKSMLKEVAAVKQVDKITLAPSYLLASKVGKVKATYPLTDGATVTAEVQANVDDLGSAKTSVEVDYATSVGDVDVSVTVTPLDKTVDVDLKESNSGIVASASMGMDGQAPSISLKRSIKF